MKTTVTLDTEENTVTVSIKSDSVQDMKTVIEKIIADILNMPSLDCETDTVSSYADKSMGVKEDAGYFEYTLTGENARGRTINSKDLFASSTITYSGGIAYAGFCSQTACANWDDAQAFVAGLNANKVGGKTTWRLLSGEADGRSLNDAYFGSGSNGSIGGLYCLWSSASSGCYGCRWGCDDGSWCFSSKSFSSSDSGFVVVCGS